MLALRQLFDQQTSTYRDLQLIRERELDLKRLLETVIHADHITGSGTVPGNLRCGLELN